ncbi:MAG: O-antigen ligase family protein [Planctomycetota bacterium]
MSAAGPVTSEDRQEFAGDLGRRESTVTLATWLGTHLSAFPTALVVILVLASLLNPIQPITEERVSYGNPILLMRLATAGVAWALGLWGLLQVASPRRLLYSLPGLLLFGLAAVLLCSALLADESTRTISLASALILAGYLIFLASTIATLGLRRTLWATCAGSVIYLLIAWFVFLAFPSVGHFYEYTDATSTVTRMGGVAHPNAIAREAAVSLVIFLGLLRFRGESGLEQAFLDSASPATYVRTIVVSAVIVLILATLVATISRTAILAGVAGVVMLLFDKLYSRVGVLLGLAACCLLISAFLYSTVVKQKSLDSSATTLVTKSGDVEELTSLTGRTLIWAEAIELIRQQPLTGYGLDSAASVMTKEAVGTHSLILHVLFSGGVLAGALMAILLVMTVGLALFSQEPLYRGLATYIFVSGLVEDTLFSSFPCQLTLAFLAMMLARTQASVLSDASTEAGPAVG